MWPVHCIQGSSGSDFHKDLQIDPKQDMIVSKGQLDRVDSYSGFGTSPEKTDLDQILKERKITSIYCCGLAYDYCVGSTAFDGAKLGYKTYVISDATKSVAQNTVEAMASKLG